MIASPWLRAALLAPALVTAVAGAGCGGSPAPEPARPVSEDRTDEDRPDSRRASAPQVDDDDDDDELQVAGLKGRLDRYDIEKGVEPHAEALTRCYTDKLGRRRYIGGDVEFAFAIARDGTVARVGLARSDLGAWPMERCLLDIARKMQFARPKGGAEAEFTLPLSFTPRRQPAYWDEARAQAEVGDHAADLAACADDAGGGEPPADAVITLYVGARGKVVSAGFASAAPVDEAWAGCAEAAMLAWVLTDPRGTVTKMSFRYPVEAP